MIDGVRVNADGQDVLDLARQIPLDEVFINLPEEDKGYVKHIIYDLESMGIACHYNIDIIERPQKEVRVGSFAGYTVVTYSINHFDYRRMAVKRLIDIVGGLVGCVLTAVITPFVAIAIRVDSPGPIFFAQTRIGKNGRRFKIYKFRSMYTDAEERKKELEAQNEMQGLMFKMDNDPRITKVGKFIRKTSIDELPQFLNIVKGDMSLVGTRPPTEGEFEQYNSHYRRRISMTPGLTGLWQISGRSEIVNFDEVVKLDLEYIDNWTLGLDIKILFRTVWVVLTGKGSK
ncbi:MAG: sugar transferase [Lachnospiraceae bacterium]|nr:sugar transferase [Lachnospiraceae bacterium]